MDEFSTGMWIGVGLIASQVLAYVAVLAILCVGVFVYQWWTGIRR